MNPPCTARRGISFDPVAARHCKWYLIRDTLTVRDHGTSSLDVAFRSILYATLSSAAVAQQSTREGCTGAIDGISLERSCNAASNISNKVSGNVLEIAPLTHNPCLISVASRSHVINKILPPFRRVKSPRLHSKTPDPSSHSIHSPSPAHSTFHLKSDIRSKDTSAAGPGDTAHLILRRTGRCISYNSRSQD